MSQAISVDVEQGCNPAAELVADALDAPRSEPQTALECLADPKGEGAHRMPAPCYRVLADVTDTKLRIQRERIQMIPEMAVTAEMKVGHRSAISYFLYPRLRGLDENIREY